MIMRQLIQGQQNSLHPLLTLYKDLKKETLIMSRNVYFSSSAHDYGKLSKEYRRFEKWSKVDVNEEKEITWTSFMEERRR